MDGAIQAGERAAFEVAQELYTASDIRQRMQKPQAPLDPEPESTEVCMLAAVKRFRVCFSHTACGVCYRARFLTFRWRMQPSRK